MGWPSIFFQRFNVLSFSQLCRLLGARMAWLVRQMLLPSSARIFLQPQPRNPQIPINHYIMKLTRIPLALGLALAGALSVQAAVFVPAFDSFGTLPGATFGGTGIPNDSVAFTTVAVNGGNLTIGLTAHQRFSENPAPTNNGAGTFSAVSGGDTFSSAPNPLYARWNVGLYAVFDGTGGIGNNTIDFYFDTNPAVGNDLPLAFTGGVGQDSQNMGFAFYSAPGFATNGFAFDPDATGEYSFALVVRNANGGEIARSAINVNVSNAGTVPDGGVTAALLGFSILGLAGLKRKFQA